MTMSYSSSLVGSAAKVVPESRASACYQRLKGPVVPINICFNDDRSVNFDATVRYIDWLCAQPNPPVLMLTCGSSDYIWLTEKDIYELTRVIAEVNQGRTLFITSTGFWDPRTVRDFLVFADEVGVDAVKVQISLLFPPSGAVFKGFFDFIEDASGIPLVVFYNPLGHFQYIPADLLDAIAELAARPNIIGVKNDGDGSSDYYNLIRSTAHEQFAVISGGLMRNFLFGYPFGSPAYLCAIAPFRPDIAHEFHTHMLGGRQDDAVAIIKKYEDPIIDIAQKVDWQVFMRTAIHMRGFYPNCNPGGTADASKSEIDIAKRFFADTFDL